MICPACGAQNDHDARFCRRCGTTLDADVTTRMPATDAEQERDTDTGPIAVVTSTAPDAGVRDCPNCDARNSARRMLCGRCGADLDTGEVRDRPEAGAATHPGSGSRRHHAEGPSTRARWTAGVVTAGLLLGGGVGAMVALDLGPFAGEPEGPPQAIFEAGEYDELPVRLSGVQVGASSVHEPENERNFDPPLMLDGDLATAWNSSGDEPGGLEERIAVEFPQPVWLTSVSFGNGDQLDDDTFLANARAVKVVLRFDAGRTVSVTLRDEQGIQAVELPDPILTTGLFIDVVEVVEGSSEPDLGMSELSFQGHVASGDDRPVADARKRFPRVRRTEG